MPLPALQWPLWLGLSALLWPLSLACNASLTRQVLASLGSPRLSTACPENTWLHDFVQSDGRNGVHRPAVVVFVGCNKGFDAISTFNLFHQDVAVSRSTWERTTTFACGVCDQCHDAESLPAPASRARPVQLYCVEPLPDNFAGIYASAARLHLSQTGFHALNAAFTSERDAQARNWTTPFPVGRKGALNGVEVVGIDFNTVCPECATVEVPLMVLDRFVEEHHLKVIDYLSIDTEGNDPNVLLGGQLSLQRVRYLEFEYHGIGAWAHTSLRDVIERLKSHGFACYWIGKGKVWRLTDCWHAAYATRQWSNVGCVQEEEREWLRIMEEYFHRTVPH
eukprot:EG_transcript_9979